MTDLLSRSPIAWPFLVTIIVALTAIAVAWVQVERQSHKTVAPTVPQPVIEVSQAPDQDRSLDSLDTAVIEQCGEDVWPEPLSADAWSALLQARLRRLSSLTPDGTEAFDTAALLRRVMYSTYLDRRELDPVHQRR